MGELAVLVEQEELSLHILRFYRGMYNHCGGPNALSSGEQERLHYLKLDCSSRYFLLIFKVIIVEMHYSKSDFRNTYKYYHAHKMTASVI
jgi:hypothetical protein